MKSKCRRCYGAGHALTRCPIDRARVGAERNSACYECYIPSRLIDHQDAYGAKCPFAIKDMVIPFYFRDNATRIKMEEFFGRSWDDLGTFYDWATDYRKKNIEDEEFRNSHGAAVADAGTGTSYLCDSNCDMFNLTQ